MAIGEACGPPRERRLRGSRAFMYSGALRYNLTLEFFEIFFGGLLQGFEWPDLSRSCYVCKAHTQTQSAVMSCLVFALSGSSQTQSTVKESPPRLPESEKRWPSRPTSQTPSWAADPGSLSGDRHRPDESDLLEEGHDTEIVVRNTPHPHPHRPTPLTRL